MLLQYMLCSFEQERVRWASNVQIDSVHDAAVKVLGRISAFEYRALLRLRIDPIP